MNTPSNNPVVGVFNRTVVVCCKVLRKVLVKFYGDRDPRFASSPPVFADDDGWRLKTIAFTPLRFSMAYEMLYGSLSTLFRITACLMVFEAAFHFTGYIHDLFVHLPFERSQAYIAMLIGLAAYQIELASGCNIARFLLGRRLQFRIYHDRVRYKRFPFIYKSVSRTHKLSFSVRKIDDVHDPLLQNSVAVTLVVDNTRELRCAHLTCPEVARDIVTQLNIALAITGGPRGKRRDFDPTRIESPQPPPSAHR